MMPNEVPKAKEKSKRKGAKETELCRVVELEEASWVRPGAADPGHLPSRVRGSQRALVGDATLGVR